MRKLLTAVSALLAALAFFVVGNPSANAFGSEVLGCDAGGYWSANSCITSGQEATYTVILVNYTPQGTSGTYTTAWSVTNQKSGVAVTQSCTVNYSNTPCIESGCTAGSMTCTPAVLVGINDKAFTAALTLTQSGQTRTVTATATIQAGLSGTGCAKC